MKLQVAQDGNREPVEVIAGNFAVMDAVFPWWDGVKG